MVPTLRELRTLEPATETRRPAARGVGWNDRHRLAFLILIAAVVCGLLSGFLIWKRPERMLLPTDNDISAVIDASRPGQVMQIYRDLEKGIAAQGVAVDPHEVERRTLLWGGVAAGLASALGVATAGVIAVRGRVSRA